MGRPKKSEGAVETKVRILEAAELEFAGHGLAGARLEDMAERVGIRRASLLHHFSSKESLYREVVRNAYEAIKQTHLKTMKSQFETCGEMLDAIVGEHFEFLKSRPSVAQLMLREIVSGDKDAGGYGLLVEELLPTLQSIEEFILGRAGSQVRSKDYLREAILMVTHGQMARVALGARAGGVYPDADASLELARNLIFPDGDAASRPCQNEAFQS